MRKTSLGLISCGVFAALLSLCAPPARAEAVDLELVFAADGSGSIDDDELRLQRRGWADALTSADVLAAIRDGAIGAVAVAYMEWGGPQSQVLVVDWHVVRDAGSARTFADRLLSAPRGASGYNSIAHAIDFSVRLVEGNAHEGTRKVIDVSGDGPNIGGRPLPAARGEALGKGFTINALAIRRPGGLPGGFGGEPLEAYYAREVIGGPGAFVEVADETRPFALAARRKLLTEIADRPAPGRHDAAHVRSQPESLAGDPVSHPQPHPEEARRAVSKEGSRTRAASGSLLRDGPLRGPPQDEVSGLDDHVRQGSEEAMGDGPASSPARPAAEIFP